VTSIGPDALWACANLEKVHISDLEAWCHIDFRAESANPLSYANELYLNGVRLTKLEIPEGISEIKKYAFNGWEGMTKLVVPDSVVRIGEHAFDHCTGIRELTIPESVLSIGNSAFAGCNDLQTAVISNSVRSVGNYAFADCVALGAIELPETVDEF
jgi:hypothetical protein